MNDRFKFRIYDIFHKLMSKDGEEFATFDYFANCSVRPLLMLALDNPERLKIMQCTGLKDKNGKLIFEGDIVKAYKQVGEIIFDKRGCYFGLRVSENETWGFSKSFLDSQNIEVIGNIYEDKELLNDIY